MTIDMNSVKSRVAKIRDDLKAAFVEREDVIENMLRAIFSRQHVVLLGEAGIAKTAATEAFVARITNAKYFKRLMRRDSCPDEILGSMSLKALENDEYKRVLDPAGGWQGMRVGNIVRAHVALIDEAFKSNSTVLNGMLDVMNERTFQNGGAEEKCDLISAFLLSNEKPEKEELAAFWDRCVVRMVVKDIQEDGNFLAFLNNKTGNNTHQNSGATLDVTELHAAINDVKTVAIKPELNQQIVDLRRKLHGIGIRPSPRRFSFILDFLKAVAWLDGRNEVESDDLMALTDCLWETEDDMPKISGILGQLASPDFGRILELFDSAKETYEKTKTNGADAATLLDANTKLRSAKQHLDKLAKSASSKKAQNKAAEASSAIKRWHAEMLSKLGMNEL